MGLVMQIRDNSKHGRVPIHSKGTNIFMKEQEAEVLLATS